VAQSANNKVPAVAAQARSSVVQLCACAVVLIMARAIKMILNKISYYTAFYKQL
jgi:hypothetical protein